MNALAKEGTSMTSYSLQSSRSAMSFSASAIAHAEIFLLRTSPCSQAALYLVVKTYKPHMYEIDTETLLSVSGKIYMNLESACLEESCEAITEDELTENGDLLEELPPSVALHILKGFNVIDTCVGMDLTGLVSRKKVDEVGRTSGLGTHIDAV